MTYLKEILFIVVIEKGTTPGSINTLTKPYKCILMGLFCLLVLLSGCIMSMTSIISKHILYLLLAQQAINLDIFCHYYACIVRPLIVCR